MAKQTVESWAVHRPRTLAQRGPSLTRPKVVQLLAAVHTSLHLRPTILHPGSFVSEV